MSDTANQQAILNFVREQTGADRIALLEYRQLSGGAIQENYGLRLRLEGGSMPGEHAFVVRSDAPTRVAASLTRAQEFSILQTAFAAGVKVPRPFWLCTDTQRIGREFYVMQWVAGSASPASLVPEDALTAAQRRQLLHDLGATVATLHQLTYTPGMLPYLNPPAGTPASRRIAECRQALADMGHARPVLALVLQYLQKHEPDTQQWVLCHRDFRTGNYLVDNGRLTALLDWEFAAWSDPCEDLGWMSAKCWRFGQNQREAGGVGDRADLMAGYAHVSGQQPDATDIAYWETMACVRWAVVALQQAQRHLSGNETSLELALTGRLVPEIEQDALYHLRRWLALKGVELVPGAAEAGAARATDAAAMPGTASAPEAMPLQDAPDACNLLQTARGVLLTEVLPVAPPEQHYNLRMAARAMGIALREKESARTVHQQYLNRIRQFYREADQPDAPISVAGLVTDIDQDRFAPALQAPLLALMDDLLNLQLQLSNPRRMKPVTI